MRHYHFIYSYKQKKKVSEIKIINIEETSVLNFPIKSFYSAYYDKVITLFR